MNGFTILMLLGIGVCVIGGFFVVLLVTFTSKSILIVISFIICIALIICIFTFIKEKITSFILSGICTLLYGLIMIFKNPENIKGYDDEWFLVLCSLTLMIPCYYIGKVLKKYWRGYLIGRNHKKIDQIKNEITALEKKNKELKSKTIKVKQYVNLVELLNICGANTDNIYTCVEFINFSNIENEISDNKNKITELNREQYELSKRNSSYFIY